MFVILHALWRKPHKLKPDEPVNPDVRSAICLKLSNDGHGTNTGHISLQADEKEPPAGTGGSIKYWLGRIKLQGTRNKDWINDYG
jgi:hypothetical protein